MALPKAVQKKVDAANKLVEELNKPAGALPVPPVEPPSSDPALVTPPADPPIAADPASITPLPQEGWEQKYKVLQGKYNAEVPRLQAQVRELAVRDQRREDQLTATQNLLASLNTQRATAPAVQEPSVTPARFVKDEEIRTFGPDLIDVMRRVAREEQSSILPQVDTKVRQQTQRIDEVASATTKTAAEVATEKRQRVIDYLHEKIPSAEAVNKDPVFLDWLSQVDPFSGEERGKLLSQAFQSHDGPRVVAFFQGFLNEHAVVTRPSAPAAPSAPAPVAPQKRLDDLVAPGTPKTGAAVTQDGSGKRVWSRAEITQFYKDKTMKYRGRQAEADKIEAEIFAAQREGRIR